MKRHLASLTSRLVLTTVAVAVVVALVFGTVTTLAVRATLTGQLDDDISASVQRFAMVDPGPGLPPPPTEQRFEAGQGPGTILAQIGSESVGGIIGGRPSDSRPLTAEELEALGAVPADGEVHRVDLPDAGSYRVVARPEGDLVLVSGLPTEQVDDAISELIWWEIALALLAIAGAAGTALVLVRRQLRPLREVAETAHAVAEMPLSSGEIDLTTRVPEHLTDERTEVGQVGAALNTLLAHVEASLDARHRSEQQVRQFVADASHELRSPLATIAGYTELARKRPDDLAATGTALDKVEEESGRMTALVEDLLLLARLDSGRPLQQEPVDLTRLLLEAVSDARVVAPEHRWRLDVPDDAVDSPYDVVGDELRLHQVATNLLSNAARHTPAGTTVTVHVRRDGFTVHDDGPGFSPELVQHAFERFARGDAARTRGGEVGVGLGLSLVEAIVAAHGGTVTLESVPGDTTLDVRLTP